MGEGGVISGVNAHHILSLPAIVFWFTQFAVTGKHLPQP